jgi:hypothetical protein
LSGSGRNDEQGQIQRAAGLEKATLSHQFYSQASNTNRIVSTRTEDTQFVADHLQTLLKKIPKLDDCNLNFGIFGALGLSLGGAVSTEFLKMDHRAILAVNIDGGIYGLRNRESISKPYLMIYSEMNHNINELSLNTESGTEIECVTLDKTKHLNLHEISFILPLVRWLPATGIAKSSGVIIQRNQQILDFVNRTLSYQ